MTAHVIKLGKIDAARQLNLGKETKEVTGGTETPGFRKSMQQDFDENKIAITFSKT